MSDYIITILKVDKKVVFSFFGLISVTGPVLGVIVGGKVISILGGYTNKKSIYIVLIVAILAACFA